jgi:hypothetical protein
LKDRLGKKSAAPPKISDAKILPEIEEVVAQYRESKIDKIL